MIIICCNLSSCHSVTSNSLVLIILQEGLIPPCEIENRPEDKCIDMLSPKDMEKTCHTIIGGAIAQSVEQWSHNLVTRVRNQGDALVSFGKALILITRSLWEDLKPSVFWLLTNKHLLPS